MVRICNSAYPSNSKYESYFELYPYPLSDFQKYAIESIVTGNHALVTAHTGSGKTLPAEFAIKHFVGLGKKVIYTSPIKALSNQKFYEFTQKYPEITFGLFTGDIKTNPNADVLIMTTEILMNYLFGMNGGAEEESATHLQFQIDVHAELACVIFDEVHYINDADRGQTWEHTILMLPKHIQMVMLSATIDNPVGFAEWCESASSTESNSSGKEVWLASTNHRVVPLTHYGYLTTTESIFKTVKDKTVQKQIRDSANKLIPLQNARGEFQEPGIHEISKIVKIHDTNRQFMKRKFVLNNLVGYLNEHEMLPAIAFVFSRKNVEACAKEITTGILEFDSKVPYTVARECEQIIRKFPNYREYLELPEYNELVALLEKGIGIHHSGMIPVLREIVELMISKKYIKLLFATESFAIGLDCPIKTAIFTSLTKFDGNGSRYLMSHEYTQMAGRAGRRGIDTIGNVVHCNNLFEIPTITEYKGILCGKPQKLVSKFHISYSMVLNLMKNGKTSEFHEFAEKSMISNELKSSISGERTELAECRDTVIKKKDAVKSARTPEEICAEYLKIKKELQYYTNKKRKDADRRLREISDEYKWIVSDAQRLEEIAAIDKEVDEKQNRIQFLERYIQTQIEYICRILMEDGCIEKSDDESYALTSSGKIASNIAEIHCLVASRLMEKWNRFESFSVKQIICLFTCFTDIKVPDDYKVLIPTTSDEFVKSRIHEMIDIMIEYEEREFQYGLQTGIRYNAFMYDLVEDIGKWCDCETEPECKFFIQNLHTERGISLGDFTKAVLKITTISKEFMNVCEQIQEIGLLHKLTQIESMVLKYITTAQSLYV